MANPYRVIVPDAMFPEEKANWNALTPAVVVLFPPPKSLAELDELFFQVIS